MNDDHLILAEYAKKGASTGLLDRFDASEELQNPICGDTVHLQIAYAGAPDALSHPVIRSVGCVGQGCVLSQASASIMTSMIKGLTPSQAQALSQLVHKMLTQEVSLAEKAIVGDMVLFEGVKQFAMRRRCVLLAWRALDRMLVGVIKGESLKI